MERNRDHLTDDDLGVTPNPDHAEKTLLGDADEVDGGPEERADRQLQAEDDAGA